MRNFLGILFVLIAGAGVMVNVWPEPTQVDRALAAQEVTVMIAAEEVREVPLFALPRPDGGFEIITTTVAMRVGGAGVLVSRQGYILTAAHLFDAVEVGTITVTGFSGRQYAAEVVAVSPRTDLALIKITPPANARWRTAKIGSPVDLRVGQGVLVCGNPYGLDWSVSTGIIAALHRDGMVYNEMQVTAPINPGNSGGPVFDEAGRVVGIVSNGVLKADGVSFAVEVGQIREFLVKCRLFEQGEIWRTK